MPPMILRQCKISRSLVDSSSRHCRRHQPRPRTAVRNYARDARVLRGAEHGAAAAERGGTALSLQLSVGSTARGSMQ